MILKFKEFVNEAANPYSKELYLKGKWFQAVDNNDLETMKMLLGKIDVDIVNYNSDTASIISVKRGNE